MVRVTKTFAKTPLFNHTRIYFAHYIFSCHLLYISIAKETLWHSKCRPLNRPIRSLETKMRYRIKRRLANVHFFLRPCILRVRKIFDSGYVLSFTYPKARLDDRKLVNCVRELLIGQVIHEPINRGVKVRPHCDIHMTDMWVCVMCVNNNYQSIRNPAHRKHCINDKQGFGKSNRTLKGRFHRSASCLSLVKIVVLYSFLAVADCYEYGHVAYASHHYGYPYQGNWKDDGVGIACHSVPYTLETLAVELVISDAYRVQQHQSGADSV